MRFSRFIIGLTSCIAFSVQAANVDEYITQLPAGANLALMVQKVGASAPAIDYHSQQMALPASTQKVITALAALIQLGPDFRFTTTLETKGNVENGVLKGDLVARFGADPTLKRQDIRNMVATLKKSGVNQIDGNVLIDTSIFASHDKAPGWPWNDMTQCFSAPPAAAIVDRNCFSVSLYSAPKPGDMAFIRVASYYPVTMFSQVRTLPRGSAEAQYCELDVVPGDLNRFTLTGCLPQRSEPLPLAFAVQDGASYAGAILKDELKQAGITWSGTLLRQTQVNEPGTVVASKQSAPLHDLLKIMLTTLLLVKVSLSSVCFCIHQSRCARRTALEEVSIHCSCPVSASLIRISPTGGRSLTLLSYTCNATTSCFLLAMVSAFLKLS